MNGYAIYELTPAPWGDDYRFLCIRDNLGDTKEILDALNNTDFDFSVYKIVEFNLEKDNV